ncbi:MAG: ATP-binding protein [Spirochaetales bacterium]|nr:ATP-binding protein [Spirochaetales bacterium]
MHRGLCDFLIEIVGNSLEADATLVEVLWLQEGDTLHMRVCDNGRGMTQEEIKRLSDPYFTDGRKHIKRKAGLGIPFLVQTLELTGGSFSVESQPGTGTQLDCTFRLDHIDTPPEGDMVAALLSLYTMDGPYELTVLRKKQDGSTYEMKRSELIDALGELETAGSHELLKAYLTSLEQG